MARFTSPDANGAPGPTGPTGPAGADGADGVGVPAGGAAGEILAKIDGTDYNTEWIENFTSVVKHEVKAGVALTKGQAVYVTASTGNDGTNMIVGKASNATEATSSKTMGLIDSTLSTNGFGYVITEGILGGLNTNGADAGDPVWLGVDGNLIYGLANKPVAPAHLVFIGIVTRKNQNNGEIFVKPQNGFELNELHNVLIGSGYSSTPTDNDILAYDTASGLWKNQTLSNLAGLTYDGTDLSLSGKLSLTASSGNEGGEIFLNKPATNTSINTGVTIDVYQNRLRIFEQGGDVRGAYIDMTKLPTGVAGELSFKSSGFVNAGVDVTLGNLRARLSASGNRNLQLSTITGTYSVYGSDVHSQNGVSGGTIPEGNAVTITTTPTSIIPGYNFTTAGATETFLLRDISSTIAWRITMIIGGSYNNNFISIERL
jgi:hypothetical protein